ncbi:MAG: hypothetical protein A2W80_07025 [Candidatus Riflebacteria bacterium GWC2_50_8]|nr:MAG: hypothetical protein A2W80_07025 [Candidatus Riflebacteria bacterium GWC2_50_8]
MSVSSVSGNSVWTQMQQFRSGKTNLQKSDLEQMQQQAAQAQNQTQAASPFDALLEAFDDIDANQDGISIDELKSYASANGIPEGGPEGGSRPAGPPPGPPPSMAGELGQHQGGPGRMPESVTKDELLEIQSQMEAEGMEVPEQLSMMISDFDSLDTNQDGKVSIDEMLAAQEDESSAQATNVETQKQDFLKLIEKYASEYSDESTSEESSDASKDLAIKFMRAINQYSSFASYSSQNQASSLFEINA